MGRLKNSLLKHMETDPIFADHYWQAIDQDYQEPVLPDKGSDSDLGQSDSTQPNENNGNANEESPF
jgi:hypothetical protein